LLVPPGLKRRKLKPKEEARSIWAKKRPITASTNRSEEKIFLMTVSFV